MATYLSCALILTLLSLLPSICLTSALEKVMLIIMQATGAPNHYSSKSGVLISEEWKRFLQRDTEECYVTAHHPSTHEPGHNEVLEIATIPRKVNTSISDSQQTAMILRFEDVLVDTSHPDVQGLMDAISADNLLKLQEPEALNANSQVDNVKFRVFWDYPPKALEHFLHSQEHPVEYVGTRSWYEEGNLKLAVSAKTDNFQRVALPDYYGKSKLIAYATQDSVNMPYNDFVSLNPPITLDTTFSNKETVFLYNTMPRNPAPQGVDDDL